MRVLRLLRLGWLPHEGWTTVSFQGLEYDEKTDEIRRKS
jgi:hypothetical protein